MRVTSNSYYREISASNNKLSDKLFDVNKQISSGQKIQYAYEGTSTFVDTLRLDNEITTLTQTKKSTESGFKFSAQTDSTLNEFTTALDTFKVKLIAAANAANSDTSLDAIAKELRGLQDHLINLANTSINGQYLFSGSATQTRPIDGNGKYLGNDQYMNSFTGSNTSQAYNVPGSDLFLGEESLINRLVVTNVKNENLTTSFSNFTSTTGSGVLNYITADDTIRDLMGDSDGVIDTVNDQHFFYLRGTQSDGTAFNQKIGMRDDESVGALLQEIGTAYGNTPTNNVVNVSLNLHGQIVVEDKMNGSSRLEFSLVGASDYTVAGGGAADVNNMTLLDSGESNFKSIINGTSTAVNPNLYIKEFSRSALSGASGTIANIEGLIYDRANFTQDSATLSSSTAQILKDGNAYASGATTLSGVADLSQLPNVGTLDGTQLLINGVDTTGTAFTAQIDLNAAGSTFSLDGGTTNFDIFTVNTPRQAVSADAMTYQQLSGVINMAMTGSIPAANTTVAYDTALDTASFLGTSYLDDKGRMSFTQKGVTTTSASMAIYDANAGTIGNPASVMTFNSNNALEVRDAKTDFFEQIEQMIVSVEDKKLYADGTRGDVRNVGIENAMQMLDDAQNHIVAQHTTAGANSNALQNAGERVDLLLISTQTLRSDVIDTDLAEASLQLQQLTLNYQAMLSTVGRVSQLSLVNYL